MKSDEKLKEEKAKTARGVMDERRERVQRGKERRGEIGGENGTEKIGGERSGEKKRAKGRRGKMSGENGKKGKMSRKKGR